MASSASSLTAYECSSKAPAGTARVTVVVADDAVVSASVRTSASGQAMPEALAPMMSNSGEVPPSPVSCAHRRVLAETLTKRSTSPAWRSGAAVSTAFSGSRAFGNPEALNAVLRNPPGTSRTARCHPA
jgi:CO/xanthine dehydrogenase Mo-binding subunit